MSAIEQLPSSRDAIAPVLGRVPSGVFIVVAGDQTGRKTGFLASWIQQASFDPPRVTVAVNKSRYLNDWLVDGSRITINQVAKGDNLLFRHFGKGFEPDADAFNGLELATATNGLPMLCAAMTTLEGEVCGCLDSGDHVLHLVTITAAHAHRPVAEFDPFVHLRKNGFSY